MLKPLCEWPPQFLRDEMQPLQDTGFKGLSNAMLGHVKIETPVMHPRGAIREQEHTQDQTFKAGTGVKLKICKS